MKDIYKNPILHYVLVSVAVALWPLLVWAVYLPQAEKNCDDEQRQCREAERIMQEIYNLDPDRAIDANDTPTEFTFGGAVDRAASLCSIPPSKYKLSSGMIITSRDQKSQSANVSLKQIDLEKFARFLSRIQLSWANLQCNRAKLTKKQGLPDMWDVDVEFKYYF